MNRPDWMDHARCVGIDPALWFPEKGENDMGRAAKRICGQCSVADDCLDFALTHAREDGIWGGLSQHERRGLQREEGAA